MNRIVTEVVVVEVVNFNVVVEAISEAVEVVAEWAEVDTEEIETTVFHSNTTTEAPLEVAHTEVAEVTVVESQAEGDQTLPDQSDNQKDQDGKLLLIIQPHG